MAELSAEQAARELEHRLVIYRFVKLAAHQLRERLDERETVWRPGSGVLRDRGAQLRIGDRHDG